MQQIHVSLFWNLLDLFSLNIIDLYLVELKDVEVVDTKDQLYTHISYLQYIYLLLL